MKSPFTCFKYGRASDEHWFSHQHCSRRPQSYVVERLIVALTAPSSDIRWSAAGALGELGDDSVAVIEALLVALADASQLVREEAAYSLSSLQSERERWLSTIENLLQRHDPIEYGHVLYPDRLFDALQKAVE